MILYTYYSIFTLINKTERDKLKKHSIHTLNMRSVT